MVLVAALLAGTGAWAGPSGGGVQRWTASHHYGAPAFADAAAVSPDGSTVFVTGSTSRGGVGHFATLAYNASTGADMWVANYVGSANPQQSGRGNALAVSPDGSTVFVTGQSGCSSCSEPFFEGFSTLAYDAATGARLWAARYAAEGGPYSMALSPDGATLFVNGQDEGGQASATVAYDAATGDRLWRIRADDGPAYFGGGLSVSPDSSTVFVVGTPQMSGGGCSVSTGGYHTAAYDASDGSVRWSSTHRVDSGPFCGTATSLDLSPDGSTVLVTGYGGSGEASFTYESGTVAYDAVTGARLWATQDGRISVFAGDTAVHLAPSPDGSKVFVSGYDCAEYPCPEQPIVTVAYDVATGNRLWVSRYHGGGKGHPNGLAVSRDGATVFATGAEELPCFAPCTVAQINAPLVAYDSESGHERWATTYTNNSAWALAVSPDGASVYLAGTFTATASDSSQGVPSDQQLAGTSSARSCSSRACGYSTAGYNTGPGPGTFQDSDHSLHYNGWKSFFAKGALRGAYRASQVRGSTATFRTPKVTSVEWLTHRGPNQGRARVSIDGHSKGTFDLYNATASARAVTFDGLARRKHTVTVRVLGRKDASSRGTWVAVDGFKVKVGSSITDESSPRVRYDAWTGVAKRAASGGSYRMSGSAAARVSLGFTGRTIKWVTATGPGYGRATVVIDGTPHRVDLYRRTKSWQAAISFTGLSKGRHYIKVRPQGTKNASSSSTDVVFDGFVVRS